MQQNRSNKKQACTSHEKRDSRPTYAELERRLKVFERKEKERKLIIAHTQKQMLEPGKASSQNKIRRISNDMLACQAELETQNRELKATQLKLEKSREHFSSLFQMAPIGYLILDEAGRIIDSNHTLCKMLLLEKGQLLDKPVADIIVSKDRQLFLERFSFFFKNPERESIKIWLKSRAGGLLVQLTGQHLSGDGFIANNISGKLLVSLNDITCFKEAEKRDAHIKQLCLADENQDKW
tara:strand:- start:517 stop:1230 length:714 start_codon:yes stop_codon:yes gene_type:complete